MKSLGYEKVIKVSLGGFMVLSIMILVVVNLYFTESYTYDASKQDITYSRQLLTATNEMNQGMSLFETSLTYQAQTLQSVFNSDDMVDTSITDQLIYSDEDRVSITDNTFGGDPNANGTVVLKGRKEDTGEAQLLQINKLENFFKINQVLFNQDNMAYPSIYYSVDNYLVQYPYQGGDSDNDLDVIAYYGVFESVKELISQMYNLSEDKLKQAIDDGWDQTTINTQSQVVTLNKSYPIVVDNRITGLLVGHVQDDQFSKMIGDISHAIDAYVINGDGQIVFTNRDDVTKLGNIQTVFSDNYDFEYFFNQFPQALEIRTEGSFHVYIADLKKADWNIIYVVKIETFKSYFKVILFNVFMVLFIGGVLFYGIKNSTAKRNKLAVEAKKSKFDGMTELLNHQFITQALELYLKNRRIKQISVMMIDIDHFKNVNDTYGHSVGDDVIKVCARTIEDVLNNYSGIVGRYGGEEFMVILPRVEELLAYKIAERIHSRITYMISEELDLNVTVSIGIHFEMMPTSLKAIDILNLADQNLYAAKDNGRNQIVKSGGTHDINQSEEADDLGQ
ncbi:MAG: GGDEF domain-containing protein [Vallitaleaceae bacterium]|jgi:diguanylate cyclase (GGDEF)-like protein|nr:GGDEF domain-containing protein [Vallitaleaceae bacterium]